jgi:hypothetical protein
MKYWKQLAQNVGLQQAIIEYVSEVGDVDETDLMNIFNITRLQAREELEKITIS